MTTTINASTSAGLVQTADTSGALALQTAGTTAVSISASQVVTLTNALPVASGGSGVTTSTGTGANVLGTSPTIATPTMTGQATIPTINLTGGQIAFPATQSASSDANTLDDYEEGTWTPTSDVALTQNFTSYYTKIGRYVFLSLDVNFASSSSTVAVLIKSLPFTPITSDVGTMHIAYTSYASVGLAGVVNSAGTINIYGAASSPSTAWNYLQASGLRIIASISYITS